MRSVALWCLFAVPCWLAGASASAQVPGGGPSTTDCWVAFQSVPPPNSPASRPKAVRCRDQDAACGDGDTTLGQCGYQVQIGLNTTSFSGCAPSSFPSGSFAIPYTGPSFDDHPKHVPDFEPLQLFADGQLPLGPADTDRWSGPTTVRVVLPVRQTAAGPKWSPFTLKLQTTLCTVALLSGGKCPAGVAADKDTFKLTCLPPIDPMTNQPVSPCTGITSTFDQIQQHIFDRKCSNLAGCHGSIEPSHDLCLKPSCGGGRSAYSDLVNAAPHNFAANSDGLLRVKPGDPDGSLLYLKVLGGARLNSPTFGSGAYGFRMPFHNPAADRARPRLTAGEIRLLKEWILAGAPATGFILSSYSCQ
ncbi:MAG: hypothetical protein KatS3mg077_2828 [Candidatus Binatia bacterium]|nr:MAG: hypothetical protein KatS3mg077_2828 [Candidatus Binatia bacterium]